MPRGAPAQSNIREVLLETYAANDRMNQVLLEHLAPAAWRAKLLLALGEVLERARFHPRPTINPKEHLNDTN